MRVAFVHDWLVTWRGGEKCLESLLKLYPDADIFTLFSTQEILRDHLSKNNVYSSLLNKLPYNYKYYRFLLPLFFLGVWNLSSKLRTVHKEKSYDLIISISHCVSKNIVAPVNVKHICYCLTPVRYIWDQYENYFSNKWYEPIVRVLRGFFQNWDVKRAKKVDKFISISNFVADRVRKYYGMPSEVIFPPVSLDRFMKDEPEIDGKYYLMVNALVPYKMTDVVVEAFKSSLNRKLIIVGDGPELNKLKSMASANIRFMGNVGDKELEKLYNECIALIYPAIEDFGIAPVEAQASGRPVICLDKGGCSETTIFEGSEASAIAMTNLSPLNVLEALDKLENLKKQGFYAAKNCRNSAIRFSESVFIDRFKKVSTEILSMKREINA